MILEPDTSTSTTTAPNPTTTSEGETKARNIDEELEAGPPRKRGKGKLIGILCLSDILSYVIGGEDSNLRSERERHPSNSSNNRSSSVAVGGGSNAGDAQSGSTGGVNEG